MYITPRVNLQIVSSVTLVKLTKICQLEVTYLRYKEILRGENVVGQISRGSIPCITPGVTFSRGLKYCITPGVELSRGSIYSITLTKICQLELAYLRNEEILGFEIAVKDSSLVAKTQAS